MYKIITFKGHNTFFSVYKNNCIISIYKNTYDIGVDISNTHKPSSVHGTGFQIFTQVYDIDEKTIETALNNQIPSWSHDKEKVVFYKTLDEFINYESKFFEPEVIDGDISTIKILAKNIYK